MELFNYTSSLAQQIVDGKMKPWMKNWGLKKNTGTKPRAVNRGAIFMAIT